MGLFGRKKASINKAENKSSDNDASGYISQEKVFVTNNDANEVTNSDNQTMQSENTEDNIENNEATENNVNSCPSDKSLLADLLKESEPTYSGDDDTYHYFAFSRQGSSHKKININCQDKCLIRSVKNTQEYIVALIADGLGSCTHSDEGAAIAICTAYHTIKKKLEAADTPSEDDIIAALKEAMRDALKCVDSHVSYIKKDISQYYSTLTIVVYDGNNAFVAHAGDDGAVVLNNKGFYGLVTTRHKGETVNSVIPLQGETNWEFFIVRDIVGIVMATDGVLDSFVLREKENNKVFFPFIEMITQPDKYNGNRLLKTYDKLFQTEGMREIISDDITLVVIVNKITMAQTAFQPFDTADWFNKKKERNIEVFKALYPNEELTDETISSWKDRDRNILEELSKITGGNNNEF